MNIQFLGKSRVAHPDFFKLARERTIELFPENIVWGYSHLIAKDEGEIAANGSVQFINLGIIPQLGIRGFITLDGCIRFNFSYLNTIIERDISGLSITISEFGLHDTVHFAEIYPLTIDKNEDILIETDILLIPGSI